MHSPTVFRQLKSILQNYPDRSLIYYNNPMYNLDANHISLCFVLYYCSKTTVNFISILPKQLLKHIIIVVTKWPSFSPHYTNKTTFFISQCCSKINSKFLHITLTNSFRIISLCCFKDNPKTHLLHHQNNFLSYMDILLVQPYITSNSLIENSCYTIIEWPSHNHRYHPNRLPK